MSSRVLLVEGTNDQHVMWALFQAHKVPQVFDVIKTGGIEQLLESVPVRLETQSGLERLAVVIDANSDIESRWRQLKDRLAKSGFAGVPDVPTSTGTVLDFNGGIRFGAWVMPDNTVPGILENFVVFLVPANDLMIPLVDSFLAGIPEDLRKYPESRIPKARIHAWLSIQEEPGKPIGQAITARYLDAEAQCVGSFIEWIHAVLISEK